ncbi:MAG: 5'-3' exonuclease H3TH domain-containing protein [Acidobacteriota bacterium]
MSAKTLLLLDGTAELYRAYYAFREFRNKKGEPTGAAFGFTRSLRQLLETQKPTHAAVVFDLPEPTFRHEAYAGYKATRKPAPPDMISQIPVVKEIVRGFSIALVESPGYEADDVIATLTRMAATAAIEVVIVTQDKDFYQLLREGVYVLNPRKGKERIGAASAERLLGIHPSRTADLLALMGDSSDNIPGVDGVGEKIAKRLVSRFSSLDALYENLDSVENPRLREKLKNQREQAFLSRSLAVIHDEVPLSLDLAALELRPQDGAKLSRIFEQLDFSPEAMGLRPDVARQTGLFDDD